MGVHHYFTDGIPIYLARDYWWAYLWRPTVWFFGHQPIINAILFRQYKKLMQTTLATLEHTPSINTVTQLRLWPPDTQPDDKNAVTHTSVSMRCICAATGNHLLQIIHATRLRTHEQRTTGLSGQ